MIVWRMIACVLFVLPERNNILANFSGRDAEIDHLYNQKIFMFTHFKMRGPRMMIMENRLIYLVLWTGCIFAFLGTSGQAAHKFTTVSLNGPDGMVVDAKGNIYIANWGKD